MPSYKKRVQSQRIPQRERPTVTPYESSYDEKYSSDEENVEYDVCEPEDLTDRSNSTVTFSEDIYDSDAVEDMIRNQIRKSQASAEGSLGSEDVEALQDASKPSKSILKNSKDRAGNKKGGSFSEPERKTPAGSQGKDTAGTSPTEIGAALEESAAAEAEAVVSAKDKKVGKGEKIYEEVTTSLQDVTDKKAPAKGEKEAVTKPLQSTIPKQTHQITGTTATNKQDFAAKGEEALDSVTKPLQDKTSTKSDSKGVIGQEIFDDEEKALKSSIAEHGAIGEETVVKSTEISGKLFATKNLFESRDKTADKIEFSSKHLQEKLLNGAVKSAQGIIRENLDKASEETSTRKTNLESEILGGILAGVPKSTTDDLTKSSVRDENVTSVVSSEKNDISEESAKSLVEILHVTEQVTPSKEKTKRLLEVEVAALLDEAAGAKETATKKAKELIDDISKTVEEILPAHPGTVDVSEITDRAKKASDEIGDRVKEASAKGKIEGKADFLRNGKEISVEKIGKFSGKEEIWNADIRNGVSGKCEKLLEDATKLKQNISAEFASAEDESKKLLLKHSTKLSGEPAPKDVTNPTEPEETRSREKPSDSVGIQYKFPELRQETTAEEVSPDTGKISETINNSRQNAGGVTRSLKEASETPEVFKKEKLLAEAENKVARAGDVTEKPYEILKNIQGFAGDVRQTVALAENDATQKSDKVSNGTSKPFDPLSDGFAPRKEDAERFAEDAKGIFSKIADAFPLSKKVASPAEEDKIKHAQGEKFGEDQRAEISEPVSTAADEIAGATKSVGDQASDEPEKPSQTIESKTTSFLSGSNSGSSGAPESSFSLAAGDEVSRGPEAAPGDPGDPGGRDENESEKPQDSDSKPRVIFRIESEDELLSDVENEAIPASELSSSTEEFAERIKKDLKATLEKEQSKLEERLSSMKDGIFDISDESLSKTKELVDERLRKISEIKLPREAEEPKREKSPARAEAAEEIKIGRFHITPASVEEVASEILERLKTTRDDDKRQEEVEKELPEKLTEADLEEVIRELKLEGLNTDIYFQPEGERKEEKKKERTLKRVERRFERMASETLEKEKEEDSVSEEKLDEKREVEFQRMISQLSSEEVAECQQEYLQLWEEGGLSSLTPTDDWESRDPDTPENELEEDSPRKSESFRGSHGTGKNGELAKTSQPQQSFESPASPPRPPGAAPGAPSSSPLGPSPSGPDGTPESSRDVPTYGERKKFWEQMSSSQSSETAGELPRGMHESISSGESFDSDKKAKNLEGPLTVSVKTAKQIFEKETSERPKSVGEIGLVKSLTESYDKKIADGELIMPAIPRPVSTVSGESVESETEQIATPVQVEKLPDSAGTAVVSELEVKLKSRIPSAPITENAVISGSTESEEQENVEFTIGSTLITKTKKTEREMSTEKSTDSEAEFLAKYGVESVAFDNTAFPEEDDESLPLRERRKIFEAAPEKGAPSVAPLRKSIYDRSMSLPADEISGVVKAKKKYFEDEMKKEIIMEQIMSRTEEEEEKEEEEREAKKEEKEIKPDKKLTKIEATANVITDFTDRGTKAIEESSTVVATAVKVSQRIFEKIPKSLPLKETHLEKSETEDNEKEKGAEMSRAQKKEEAVPLITVTTTGKRQIETGSVGESEDTQSESDVTPEDARIVDDGESHWDGSGAQSPKDDLDYGKETGMRETGIGRWIGQEDLSKQSWEKDDLDSSHFKIQTKWERTRSEGASPKEHHVYTPEEHYPDTVWEVPVQEQLEKEEVTHDIPIEKQVIIEKDEEEEDEEEEKKLKLTEEEAKEIAEEILEYIQFEVENRSSFLADDYGEEAPDAVQSQVSDYLRHLAADKDLDDEEVQLIESVIMKKHRDQYRKSQINTTASSIDITDEELRSSGADNDISPVESQITKLQNLEEEDFIKMSTEVTGELESIKRKDDLFGRDARNLKDVEIVDRTIAEVKESLEAAQEQLIEQHKKRKKNEVFKKESPSEFEFRGISYERSITEAIKEQTSDWEKVSEYEAEAKEGELGKGTEKTDGKEQVRKEELEEVEVSRKEGKTRDEKLVEEIKDSIKYTVQIRDVHEEEAKSEESGREKFEKKLTTDLFDEEKMSSKSQQISTRSETRDGVDVEGKSMEKSEFEKSTKKSEVLVEERVTGDAKLNLLDSQTRDRAPKQRTEREREMKDEKIRTSSTEEKEKEMSKNSSVKSEERVTETKESSAKQSSLTSSRSTETSKADSKTSLKSLVTQTDDEKVKNLEISVSENYVAKKIRDQRHSSEDSPRSTSTEEFVKSPPAGGDISSADKPGEMKSEKSDIVLRHSSSSSINTLQKADRRSGTDLEPYSSSGESHYHSFEQASSRPCSSDVELLMAGNVGTAGSSEYESALSQDASSKQATSTDYHTAVSSLSSRESIKSLDSESSGHLASVEVSSEASETLIPSALELDKDLETPGGTVSDDDGPERAADRPPPYSSQTSAPAPTAKSSIDEDFEIVSESEVASWAGEVSEDEEDVPVPGEELVPDEEHSQKMKRSYEMTFQPEPKAIVFSESLDGLSRDNFTDKLPPGLNVDENSSIISVPDERLGSSLEESGSVLSVSLSTTSEPSVVRTVIELSRTDSEKMDVSLTVSATSVDSASREDSDKAGAGAASQTLPLTNEMSTSTAIRGTDKKTASVTITTSSTDEHGIPSVSTQVTSVSRKSSMADEARSESESSVASTQPGDLSHANGPTQVDYVADYDEVDAGKTKKAQGHRRKESTSNFVPTMMWNVSEARTQKVTADFSEIEEEYESDKYVYDVNLTEKEVKNDEKKEADDLESFESHGQEGKISEGEEAEEFRDYDGNRPQSQTSRTDSESGRRPVSSAFSEDRPDSELSELMKQGSSETEREDPLERPVSPEPEDVENKDITPELSSEAQASVTELEMEYSGAYSRRDEYASHVSPIREEKSEGHFRDATADEEERKEEERVSDGLRSQTSLESTVAEKHELETGEKEILQKKLKTVGGNDIPDITVTEHMTPVLNEKFQYPDSKEEAKEKKNAAKTPDTPASTSSRTSSTSTDQGREYSLDEAEIKKFPREVLSEEKEVNETKDDKESLDSPSSDSFEMLDKPDISDEFVIIEEVGREAQENDREGKSIQIASQKKKMPKRAKEEEEEVILSPTAPSTKMTELKYFPSDEEPDLFPLDSDSPPQPSTRRFAEKLKRKSSKEEKEDSEYEQQIEQSKKWVEMQFQGEQAAKIVGAYGYEMEYERAPLEDIKEEDLNELESSSKIGSMGSQKESLGSFGSVKDSFSSTPDYDVLAGKKYFTRSGDHDDVSMSSLQEFELIEKKLMENGKKSGSSSSQDSLSSKKLGTSSKSGQGDDISQASLREFENLENACATVVKMETKAKQEEAILSEIDEGHESQISESESCETVSAVMREKIESDSEDFDKRMFEIDEIIRQAQSNVERFSEMQALEKIESMGRGDSYEEVAKVPDLELDTPLPGRSVREPHNPKQDKAKTSYSTQVVTKKKVQQWRAAEEEQKPGTPTHSAPKAKPEAANLLESGGKIKSISVDSLEIQAKKEQMMLEEKDDTISLDSYRRKSQKSDSYGFSEMTQKSDSMEEVSTSLRQHENSSGEPSLSGKDACRPPPRAEFMLGSTDSLDPSSSTATHATYQYETDSVMSSSFTSGGSNTMVSSTDNLDLLVSGQSVIDLSKDFEVSKTGDWLERMQVGSVDPSVKKRIEDKISGLEKIQLAPEIQKIAFEGPDAEKALQAYLSGLGPEEEVVETNEIDEYGNIRVKKVLRQRVVVRRGESGQGEASYSELPSGVEKITFTGPDAEEAFKNYTERLKKENEIVETEEVDEHGNVHIKKILKQRIVAKPEDLELEGWKKENKISREEKTLQRYIEMLKENEDAEIEIDEQENVHKRKVLRGQDDAKPSRMLTREELEQYLDGVKEPEFLETEGSSRVIRQKVEMPSEVEKITFRGPDAEKQMEEFLARQQQEQVEEIEEVDEQGNVRIKRVLRQRVFIRPKEMSASDVETLQKKSKKDIEDVDDDGSVDKIKFTRRQGDAKSSRILTEEELRQYLDQIEEPQFVETEGFSRVVCEKIKTDPDVEKITFKGAHAEKKLEEFIARQKSEEVEVIEEEDERGNVHLKRISRQRMVVRAEDAEQGLQKVAFEGPHADQAFQAFMESIGSEDEVAEIEEEDEHGNIRVRKVLRRRVIIRPEELGDRQLTKEELREYLKARSKETTFRREKVDIGSTEAFVSEIIEPLDDHKFSHIIHRKVQMGPEVQKVAFRGPDADEALETYVEALAPGEDFEETEEVDEDGNVHVKRITRRKIVLKPEDLEKTGLSGEELKSYLRKFEYETFEGEGDPHPTPFDHPTTSTNQTLTEAFSSSIKLTEKEEQSTDGRDESGSTSAIKKESGISQRPPLLSDISLDDEAEYDTTEHDWRHQLEILHAEADEDEIDQNLDAALAASSSPSRKNN